MEFVKEGNSVLYLWGKLISDDIKNQVNDIKVIKNVTVNVENVERLGLGKEESSRRISCVALVSNLLNL